MSDQDLDGWRALAEVLDTPLAGVDAVRFTTEDYAIPMSAGAFDIVRMDAGRQGISQLSALSKVAESMSLGCEGHAFGPALSQAANFQAALSTTSSRYCELPVPLGGLDRGVKQGLSLDAQGYVNIPDGPGLGLEVVRDELDAVKV